MSGKSHLFFRISQKKYAAIFVIFGMHHPNGSKKWVIKHFTCILTAGVRNNDVIVASVKMPFTEEDKHVFSVLRKD